MNETERLAETLIDLSREIHDLANEVTEPDKAIEIHKLSNRVEDVAFELNSLDRKGRNEVKRFIVFAHDYYYPDGGMEDIIGDYDTLDEANEIVETLERTHDWVEILDLKNKVGDW